MAPEIKNNLPSNSNENESVSTESSYQFLDNPINLIPESDEENETDLNIYQPLTQECDLEEVNNEDMFESIVVTNTSSDCSTVESNTKERETSFQMDQEHINKIKSAMSGFVLPSSCIPNWASIISEDEWKGFIKKS